MCSLLKILFGSVACLTLYAQQPLSLIPWPVQVNHYPGSYLLKNTITVSNSFPKHEWPDLFRYFRNEMKKQYGITVIRAAKGQKADISFDLKDILPGTTKPVYTINVTEKGVNISSNSAESAFHAMQTLFQLLPVEPDAKKQIPFVNIFDYPRFAYRGMHLDVGRHFFPVSFIKKYIDYLAYHKLNKFHWHLTEDQGWRIEIKKYPKLTSIGSKRYGTIIGRYPGQGNDNIPYGGYYTQQEVKEVVQYARERFVEVIPEIEMPGHCSAAIAAYPWLSCFPDRPTKIPASMISKKAMEAQKKGRIKLVQETWGVFDDVFCAGNDSVFTFLQHVIDEVISVFPSKYFHIGGDEVPKKHWKECTRCQQRIKELKLKDEHELQSYFVLRIEKYLNSKGKILIGWDEILEGGLAPNAIVMSWRGEAGGIEAAKQKHYVIMTPGNPVYFDHSQSEDEDSVTIGGYNPIEKVYAYEPVPKELREEEAKYVLGAQANVWTEYMKNTKKVEYMIFPRMAALCEVLWSQKEYKNWEEFEKRLNTQFKRYDKWGANYSRAYFNLKATVLPSEDNEGVLWKVEGKIKTPIMIRFNNSDSTGFYTKPQKITSSVQVAHAYYYNVEGQKGFTQRFYFNKATGKKITLAHQPSATYPGDGAFTLVNGVQNEKGLARIREFLGFNGVDCIATIDMDKPQEISLVKVHYLHQPNSWIHQPASINVFISENGDDFTPVLLSKSTIANNEAICEFFQPVNARFLKIAVANAGIIPEGQPGAGNKAWLFVDEIEVH